MAEICVRASADELVIFFESNSGAPILSEMPASPESDGDADPCEGNASEGKSVGARENAMAEDADARCPAEKQDKACYFQEENTVTRGERFAADCAARLERARRPIDDEDNPGNLNEQWPRYRHRLGRNYTWRMFRVLNREPLLVNRNLSSASLIENWPGSYLAEHSSVEPCDQRQAGG